MRSDEKTCISSRSHNFSLFVRSVFYCLNLYVVPPCICTYMVIFLVSTIGSMYINNLSVVFKLQVSTECINTFSDHNLHLAVGAKPANLIPSDIRVLQLYSSIEKLAYIQREAVAGSVA